MALKTKAKISDLGEILSKKGKEFTFQDPPLIDAPNSQISKLDGSARQIPDPTQSLSSVMGIERIPTLRTSLVPDEKGPNGEEVYETQDKDPRIKLYGPVIQNPADTNGTRIRIAGDNGDVFVEVVFYGTGINVLQELGSISGVFTSIDGGAETDISQTQSSILDTRNYRNNKIINLYSGLSLGIHTLRLRKATAGGFHFSGFEVINESSQIQVPAGEVFYQGRKYIHPSAEAIDYNDGFDGSPVLNGRGGRVVEYITPEGEIGKVIQQTDASQGNLASADHSNEEITRQIAPREFGANRGDDFSTISTSSTNRAFTLDDGTTTLSGNNISGHPASGPPILAIRSNGGFASITFVGTGLDIIKEDDSTGGSNEFEYFVDGNSIGSVIYTPGSEVAKLQKVVSGLPYGTHTVKIQRNAATTATPGISKFITYGPKKPSIPEDAAELQEYYLTGDFDSSGMGVDSPDNQPQGTLYKSPSREMLYEGGLGTIQLNLTSKGGIRTRGNAVGSKISYTFFGTGIVWHGQRVIDSVTYTATIDGSLNDTGVGLVNTTNDGGGTYTSSGNVDESQMLEFTGLSLGLHTIELEKTGGSGDITGVGFEVITPIHFPNTKVGSLSMGPSIQLNRETGIAGPDLTEAKCWIHFDGNANQILSSYNVSAVVDKGTGIWEVFFEKPMKNDKYPSFGTAAGLTRVVDIRERKTSSFTIRHELSGSGPTDGVVSAIIFGELAEEEN